ncbi:MAG: acyl-CoA thioesterase [Opitutales bacterium]
MSEPDAVTTLPFRHYRTVEFAETDMAGIAHFANFFRWMESAENAFVRALGGQIVERVPEGFRGWPRVRASAKFQAPVRLGDRVCVELTVAEVKDRSIDYRCTIVVEGESRVKAATGQLVVAYVEKHEADGPMRPLPLPEALRARLEGLLATNTSATVAEP